MKIKLYFYGRFWMCCVFMMIVSSSIAQQVARSLTAPNSVFIGFYEYKPVDYDANPTTKYPLIIFLHGIGERGDGTSQLPFVLANAIPKYISQGHPMRFYVNGQWQTFLVLTPQLSTNYGSWQNFYVDEMLKYAKQNMRVDTNKMYLTGLSLGGGGTWKYATNSVNNARQFAAIAPICGTCEWSNVCNLAQANTPVWAFHAQDDGVVGVGCTTGAISMLNSCSPPTLPLMTIYPNGNHWIWDMAYDTTHSWQNPNIYEWFLGHSRSSVPLPPNVPPIANAGSDQSITIPTNSIFLNGSGSSDPDGSIIAYTWTKISGPAQYTISNFDQAFTAVNNLVQGTYTFQLTVTDNRGATASDVVVITVNPPPPGTNLPPIAVAGSDVTINVNNFTLNSWGSFDPDGSISAYQWTKIAGPAQITMGPAIYATASVSNMVNGTYSFELIITDNLGLSTRDTVNITVALPNIRPVANAGPDQAITVPASSVTLNGTASSDADGTISTYAWSKVSGPASYTIVSATGSITAVNSLTQGVYAFRLVVTDNNGGTDDDTVVVTVNGTPPPPNIAPIANAGVDQNITLPTNSVTLNGTASSDVDGTISSYAWTKISGPASFTIVSAAGSTTAVNNLAQGVYSFRLAVTDNNGATDDDTVLITVNAGPPPPPNIAPIANAGADQNITLPANSVTLNGTASSDADGAITTYAWTKISGPASSTIVNPAGSTTAVNNLTAGTYSFRLVVTDNIGATDDDTVMVSVNGAPPPPNLPPVASAGNDQSITLPTNSVTLNGSGSADPDGAISSFAWSKISGPAAYTIVNYWASSTVVNGLVQGTYSFRLVVADYYGATDDDTVTIVVNAAPPPPNVAPVANAGVDQSITLPANSITLNGTGSTDSDGSISSYAWTTIAGPAGSTIVNPNGSSTVVNGLVQGTYGVRLVVTDNNGATDADTMYVIVYPVPPPANIPPQANAGADQNITLPGNSVTLNGASSTDADGTIASYAWIRVSGPATYTLASPNAASTALTGLVQGTYQFQLTVTDNNGASDLDTVSIVVNAAPPPPNIPPVANAGADQNITLPTNTVTLNGTASSDADGTISSFAWTKITGPASYNIVSAGASSTAVNNLTQGAYTFRLVVTDNNGGTDDDTVSIVVNAAPPPPNIAPVSNAGPDQIITLPVNSVTLDGTASADADGTISSYAWSKISGPASYTIINANGSTTAVNNLAEGIYSFRLVVTDNNGATDDDTVLITVNGAPPPPNVAPVADAGADQSITLPTNSVTLNGTASSDADGTISSYTWTKISGPSSFTIVNANASATAVNDLTEGTYSFRLTVTDNYGAVDDDTVLITVNTGPPPPPNVPPVANAGGDQSITLPVNSVTLSGTASSDADGTITTYAWAKISGPTLFSIINPLASNTAVNNLMQGVYLFRLTVTDNDGATDHDTVSITVNPAPLPPNVSPIANAGNDITVSLPVNGVQLNGTASSDPDGGIVSYEWNRVSGPTGMSIVNATSVTPTLVGLVEGDYVIRLTVTDNAGATGTDEVTVHILAMQNLPPVANAGRDTTIAVPSTMGFLNGTASRDPDGRITRYQWRQMNGPVGAIISNFALPLTTVTSLQPGYYNFELTVTDNVGATHKDTVSITVVDNFRYEEELTIYPNPVMGPAHVRCITDSTGNMLIRILDMNGVVVQVIEALKSQTYFEKDISLYTLKSGVYYIEAIIGDKKRMIRKFIKQ